MWSSPPSPLTASSSVGSWCWIATAARSPETATPEAFPLTSIVVAAGGAVDDYAICRAVALRAADGRGEIDVHRADVGAGSGR